MTEPAAISMRGREIAVNQALYRCDACGDELQDLWQIDAARTAAAHRLNQEEGLLQPEEIKALRESLRLSQAAFEAALGLGPKTMVRWEIGKVMPARSMALLLLLLRRDPGAFGFLRDLPASRINEDAVQIKLSPRMRILGYGRVESVLVTGSHPVAHRPSNFAVAE